jgi:SpoVK/Ycf46/Vps4 family AAA+-type ATPase
LPLAATDIRQKAPEDLTARSLLLYGPKGSGKSMLARAIATETGATFFDLSPAVIEGTPDKASGNAKLENAKLVYKVFICAQEMAPSVIYIDQVEQVFQSAKKKKGGDANAPNRIMPWVAAAIKQIKRGPESTEQDRILFIGCTYLEAQYRENLSPEMIKSFDEKVWVSFPEYGSRVMLWQKFMENHKVFVDPTKLNSTLASVSEGYSTGSIKQTVDRVLTTRRVQQEKNRPLKVQEFLGPLSRTAFCWPDDYCYFRDFDFKATGEEELHLKRLAEAEGEDNNPGKKGKGK